MISIGTLKKTENGKEKTKSRKNFNSVQNQYFAPKQVVWWWYGLLQQFSAIKNWISCLEQSRMWHSEWLDSNDLDYWPFGILTYRKSDLEHTTRKKKIVGSANLDFYSGPRCILRASYLVSWFFQYNLQFSEKTGISQMKTPVACTR